MGDGDPPVLLIHGFASNPEQTWRQTGWIAALEEAGRSWHAPLLPGHADAGQPLDVDSYRVPVVLERLLSGVGEEPVDVVGYSMGGALALQLAITRPQAVRRLVAGGVGVEPPFDEAEAEGLLADVSAGRPPAAGAASGLWAMAEASGYDRRALAAGLAGFAAGPRSSAYEAFAGPALLFGGSEDEFATSLPDLAARLPGSELLMLPRRNHLTALSSGRARREAVDFLQRE